MVFFLYVLKIPIKFTFSINHIFKANEDSYAIYQKRLCIQEKGMKLNFPRIGWLKKRTKLRKGIEEKVILLWHVVCFEIRQS